MITQVYDPITNAKEAEVDYFYENLQHLLELMPKRDIFFTIGDQKAKPGIREILRVTSLATIALEYKMKQCKGYQASVKRTSWLQQTPFSNKQRGNSTHRHHGHRHLHIDINSRIRVIIFFTAKDGEALYSQKNRTWS